MSKRHNLAIHKRRQVVNQNKSKYSIFYLSNLNNEIIWAQRHSHTPFFKKCASLHTHSLIVCFETFKMCILLDTAFLLPGIQCQKTELSYLNKGAPGWLTRLSVQLYFRSSNDPRIVESRPVSGSVLSEKPA